MKKTAIAISLLAVLSGCTTYYSHADPTDQRWARDYAFCSAQGGQASGANDPYGAIRTRTEHNCLVGKGWSKE